VDEPQIGQWYEDVERKRENYYITIFLKGLEILHRKRRGQVNTMVMDHFNSILFHKSTVLNKQQIYQSIRNIIPLL
jgi:hypothetical protein